jgi:hypothetical protein
MSFVMSSEVETSLLLLVAEPWKRKRNSKRFLHFGRNDNDASEEDGGELKADRRSEIAARPDPDASVQDT